MLALIVVLAVVLGILGIAFWNVTRAEPNSGPALGTNNPYPDGVGLLGPGEDAPTFMPTPIISSAEEFRRDAHLHLTSAQHTRTRTTAARSWMEEPGAMEAAGLVDKPEPPTGERPASGANESSEAPNRGLS
jgi:hypothetical protein